jgi:two-component system, NtrC family, sensor histidine kinase HydH
VDIRTQTALLACIVATALGLSMVLRADRPRVLTVYSVFAFTVGTFYLAGFLQSIFLSGGLAGWPVRIAVGVRLLAGALVPSAALGFFLEFLGGQAQARRTSRRVALFSGLLGLGVALTPLATSPWGRGAVTVWAVGALLLSVSLLIRRVRRSDSRTERARLTYLAIGAAASLLFSALDGLPLLGVPFPTLGPVVTTLYLFFLAQTLLRLRLMDLHELLGKVASQTVLAVMLAAVFTVLTAWVHGNTSLYLFNTVLAAFVMCILLEPLRVKVEAQVVHIFFRERSELLRSLAALRARLATVIDPGDAAGLTLDALEETRRVTHASVYFLAEDRPGFRRSDFRGPEPVAFLDTAAARGLLAAAASGQKAVLLENLERRMLEMRTRGPEGRRSREELKRTLDTRAAMLQLKSALTVPLVGGDRVVGFLNLWDERVPEAFASDEIALLLEIAERLATTVENSKLYERMRERDRLAALGEMAAGLAHEIRNPLGAIKGAAQCLDPPARAGEEGEFLDVIVEEVNRLNGVVTEFLDYARPLKQSFGTVDINEVVARTIRLIQNELPPALTLSVDLATTLPPVEGEPEQLKQVLINLVQNGIQALGGRGGVIRVRTRGPEPLPDLRGGADFVEIEVTDDGPGIPTEQQPHIFVPFYTTKQKGTGLGLAICQRIVKNHGGSISVTSRVGEGTTFVVRLPALAPSTAPRVVEPARDGTPAPGEITLRRSPRDRARRRQTPG